MSEEQQVYYCECAEPGFCRRTNRTVDAQELWACQTNAGGYRDHWFGVKPIEPPTLTTRIWNFAMAELRDLANGRERRSEEEVERIAAVCQQCEFFNGHVCRHGLCGCNVTDEVSYWNKAARTSEHCPIGKW